MYFQAIFWELPYILFKCWDPSSSRRIDFPNGAKLSDPVFENFQSKTILLSDNVCINTTRSCWIYARRMRAINSPAIWPWTFFCYRGLSYVLEAMWLPVCGDLIKFLRLNSFARASTDCTSFRNKILKWMVRMFVFERAFLWLILFQRVLLGGPLNWNELLFRSILILQKQ